jgi:hypothetical protein
MLLVIILEIQDLKLVGVEQAFQFKLHPKIQHVNGFVIATFFLKS